MMNKSVTDTLNFGWDDNGKEVKVTMKDDSIEFGYLDITDSRVAGNSGAPTFSIKSHCDKHYLNMTLVKKVELYNRTPQERALSYQNDPNNLATIFRSYEDRIRTLIVVNASSNEVIEELKASLSEVANNWRQANDRLIDLLLADDGQAYQEAEEYLRISAPDAYEHLQELRSKQNTKD